MRTFTKRALVLPALVTTVAMLAPAAAIAHPGASGVSDEGVIAPGSEESKQHDGQEGHLPGVQRNVELVGRADIKGAEEGRVADVAAFGNFAYLTVRDPAVGEDPGCSDGLAGVAIMDISVPDDPRQVGFIEASPGSFPGEGAQVLNVATKRFTGQILLFNNEICGENGRGGVSMWDVTDPEDPARLSAHAGDTTIGDEANPAVNDIHSVLGWTDRDKAYAVLVDNAEGADVDILDISDPVNPVLVSETDLNDFNVLQEEGTPLGANSFLHDVEVQRIRGTMTMIASYWDGGWVLLDVDNPAKPVYIRDFDYAAKDSLTGLSPSEGNAHQAEFSPDGGLFVGTDEDFNPFRLTLSAAGKDFQAAQGSDTPQLDAKTGLAGSVVFVGRGCDVDPMAPATKGQIAVIERGLCAFTQKAANAEKNGYAGVVLFNSVSPTGCASIVTPSVEAGIPVVSVGRDTAYALFGAAYDNAACIAGGDGAVTSFAVGTTAPAAISVAAVFDGWGGVRLVDTQTMREIDSYAIRESLDPRYATRFGDLSVHEVAVDPRANGLAYLSYYSGGLRVVEYDRNGIREVGAYIDEGGNNFWGVEYHQLPQGNELILASDRDSGLWIFRYTGGN